MKENTTSPDVSGGGQPSAWEADVPQEKGRIQRMANVSSALDVILYGGVGAVLFVLGLLLVGRVAWGSSSVIVRNGFVAVVALAAAQVILDLNRGKLTITSKIVVGAWVLMSVAVAVLEIFAG